MFLEVLIRFFICLFFRDCVLNRAFHITSKSLMADINGLEDPKPFSGHILHRKSYHHWTHSTPSLFTFQAWASGFWRLMKVESVIPSRLHREKWTCLVGQQALPRCHALVYAACFPSRRGEYPISVLAPRTKPNQLESSKHPSCEVRLGWAASFSLPRRRGVAEIPWAWFSLYHGLFIHIVRLIINIHVKRSKKYFRKGGET